MKAEAEELLKIEHIKKSYEGNEILKDLSLTIHKGEVVVIIGPSGCGKSTTLRMIAGFEEITSGDLFIDGKRVNEVAPEIFILTERRSMILHREKEILQWFSRTMHCIHI